MGFLSSFDSEKKRSSGSAAPTRQAPSVTNEKGKAPEATEEAVPTYHQALASAPTPPSSDVILQPEERIVWENLSSYLPEPLSATGDTFWIPLLTGVRAQESTIFFDRPLEVGWPTHLAQHVEATVLGLAPSSIITWLKGLHPLQGHRVLRISVFVPPTQSLQSDALNKHLERSWYNELQSQGVSVARFTEGKRRLFGFDETFSEPIWCEYLWYAPQKGSKAGLGAPDLAKAWAEAFKPRAKIVAILQATVSGRPSARWRVLVAPSVNVVWTTNRPGARQTLGCTRGEADTVWVREQKVLDSHLIVYDPDL